MYKLVFIVFNICTFLPAHSQNTRLESFGLLGSVKSFTENIEYNYDSLNTKGQNMASKKEYFFNEKGLLVRTNDSLFNTTTEYFYNKNNKCIKQAELKAGNLKFLSLLQHTDTCIISKVYDSANVFLFEHIIKVDENDRVVGRKTSSRTGTGYHEDLTVKYDARSLPISVISIVGDAESSFDNSVESSNNYMRTDKHGNWLKCIIESNYIFSQKTLYIRRIMYR